MSFETDSWPYVPAKYIGPKRSKPVRGVVIHTAENDENGSSAENLAKYFQHPDYTSSATICVDNTSIVQCVKDSYIAYAAPGTNEDFIQIELCGTAGQSGKQWLDQFSIGAVALAADATAQYCLKYGLPPVHMTTEQLLAGGKGIIGHYQATEAYKRSDHTDPGKNFPWVRFISMVNVLMVERRGLL